MSAQLPNVQRLSSLVDGRIDNEPVRRMPNSYAVTGTHQQSTGYQAANSLGSLPNTASGLSTSATGGVENMSMISQDSVDNKKIEAEIEAERLWWSEISERQVKDLESTFGMEFQKTTDKLRADISRCQDRLEMLVEQEKSQRQATTEALRRELDNSQVMTNELAVRMSDLKNFIEADHSMRRSEQSAMVSQVDGAQKTNDLVARLQSDLEASRSLISSNHAALRSEWEQQKMQTTATEVAVSDLRRELLGSQEHQELFMSHIKDLRRDLTSLAEKVQLQAHSNDEAHALHKVVMQSAGDLSNGIEEVSSSVLATEQKLRQELAAMCCSLEASMAKHRVETLEALDLSSEQLVQSLADEVEKRGLEANILSARLDALHGQLDDLQVTSKRTAAALESTSTSGPQATSEVQAMRFLVDSTKQDLLRLEVGMRDDRSTRLNDMAEIRRYTEDAMNKCLSQARVEAGAGAQGLTLGAAANRGGHELSSAKSSGVSDEAMQSLRADMALLQANLQLLGNECKRSLSVAARTEAELQNVVAESPKTAGLAYRIEGIAGKVDVLESEVKQFGAITGRLDAAEAEVRRAAREASPLAARMDAAESELLRVVRNSTPLAAKVEAVSAEVKELGVRLSGVTPATATTADSQAPPTVSTHPAVGNSVMAPSGGVASSRVHREPSRQRSQSRQSPEPRAPTEVSVGVPPNLSRELKFSIEQLVSKVNSTLQKEKVPPEAAERPAEPTEEYSNRSHNGAPTAVDILMASAQVVRPGGNTTPPVARNSMPATLGGGSWTAPQAVGLSSMMTPAAVRNTRTTPSLNNANTLNTLNTLNTAPANAISNPAHVQEGYFQALQAVQELRERNLCLREENAELVEELLNQDGMISASPEVSFSVASQSTCATPSQHQLPSAQLPAGTLGRGGHSPDLSRGQSPDNRPTAPSSMQTTPMHAASAVNASSVSVMASQTLRQVSAANSLAANSAGAGSVRIRSLAATTQSPQGSSQAPSWGANVNAKGGSMQLRNPRGQTSPVSAGTMQGRTSIERAVTPLQR